MIRALRAGLLRMTAALFGLAAAGLCVTALAGNPARLNIGVRLLGFTSISNLTAAPGAAVGSINLNWTEPYGNGVTGPFTYDIRVSTLAQISNNGEFNAAAPLSAFASDVVPVPGPGGGAVGMVVTGLQAGVTHYFAIREVDSTGTPYRSIWLRNVAQNFNVNNAARAKFLPVPPAAINDFALAITGIPGQALLSWTSPLVPSGVKVSSYTLVYSTVSAADLAGDTTAWFNLASATRTTIAPALSSGTAESVLVDSLPNGTTVFFGIRSADFLGQISDIDTAAAGVTTQVKVLLLNSMNIVASTGAASGSINLSWVEPFSTGLTPPMSYQIRVSTTGNIEGNAGFNAALPLSSFSAVTIPAPGPGGGTANLTVTALIPGVTHYFAIRLRDSNVIPFTSNWVRDAGQSLNQNNFAPAHFIPNLPSATTDLVAAPGVAEGEVALTFTAPLNTNFVPMASYQVRYATFSVASLGGDATYWFTVAPNVVNLAAQAPGTQINLTIPNLAPLATWYFSVRSLDVRNELSPPDVNAMFGAQASTMPRNFAPPAPSGFNGVAGLRRATISWADLTAPQKGLAFGQYKLYRSTDPVNNFINITTTTALTYLDRPLTSFVTYYYKISSFEGPGGLEGVTSSTISVVPYTLAPQEPFGVIGTPSSTTVLLTWTQTERFSDTSLFFSTNAPETDELQGYEILRSTNICSPSYVQIATMTFTSTTFSENTMGNNYFYKIRSFNTFAPSTSTLVLTALGDQHFFLDDCATEIVMTREQALTLTASSNTLAGDVLIQRRRRTQDTGAGVMSSVEFLPLLNGVQYLPNFTLPTPARIVLRYNTDVNGGVVPQDGFSAQAGFGAAAIEPKNLGMFWNNGAEFKKLYGKVNTLDQTVEVESPNLGVYQIRALFRGDSAVFDVSNVSGKVITPNDDGLNDVFIITYDPGPRNVLPTGVIYDMRGAFVANLTPGLVPNTLVWNGRMNSAAAAGGVYVYQIKGDGKTFNGTIVVAK